MKLNYNEAMLLWSTIAYTGKMQPGQQGEVPEPRGLNGEESAQRGHFKKRLVIVEEELTEELTKAREEYKTILEATKIATESLYPKKEDESDEDYTARINKILDSGDELKEPFKKLNETVKEINGRVIEFELTEKTLKVLKKYFEIYGNEVGFKSGDDESVISLTEKLEPIQLDVKL